jgi:hypothetical protein
MPEVAPRGMPDDSGISPEASPSAAWRVHKVPGLKECFMLDIIMLALGLGFFVLAIGYGYACERL